MTQPAKPSTAPGHPFAQWLRLALSLPTEPAAPRRISIDRDGLVRRRGRSCWARY